MKKFVSQHHSFDIHLAKEYGVDEAIMIHHFQFWIQFNINKNINKHDGRTWTYQTLKDIAAHFEYWTEEQVREIIEKLCSGRNRKSKKDDGVDFEPILIKGNYNKKSFDKTTWYAFKNQEMFTKGDIPNSTGDTPNSTGDIPKPIPDTKPYSKTEYKKGQCLDDALFKNEKKKMQNKDPNRFVKALNPEQKKLHDELISFNPKWGLKLKSDSICAWFLKNKWSIEKVRMGFEVYKQDVQEAIERGDSVRDMGGSMVSSIKNMRKTKNESFEVNRDTAELMSKRYSWMTLTKKYVSICFENFKQEVYFNISTSQFISEIESCKRIVERYS